MKGKLSLLFLCVALTANSQNTIGTKTSLVPPNWTVFNETVGDLNKDTIPDVAIIIENSVPNEEGEKDRSLLILLKNNKVDDTYMQVCRADNVILGSQSGGVWGEPFESMAIQKNVLIVNFFGGAREKWGTTHRYRYQGGAFYVIGATLSFVSDNITETYDYNVSNGKIIITKVDEENKANNSTKNLQRKIILPELSTFSPEALWAIVKPNDYAEVSSCVLKEFRNDDCGHLIFDCGDFGNAILYLDVASEKLWRDLTVEPEMGDIKVNPAYKGKTFEITYASENGIRCESAGKAPYQLVVGFKLKN